MTSEPPPASSWAAAPEFYTDENSGTRAVRRLLLRLGYIVHTPAELYGGRRRGCARRRLARESRHPWLDRHRT
jgi:hypothetical protein